MKVTFQAKRVFSLSIPVCGRAAPGKIFLSEKFAHSAVEPGALFAGESANHSPSPGGEGRGEGERVTDFFKKNRQPNGLVFFLALMLLASLATCVSAQPRTDTLLDSNWRTVAGNTNSPAYAGFEQPGYDDHTWKPVEVPHNWDDYGGDHRLINGHRHGIAWYRREFFVPATESGRRIFLYFEGVGSYATVWVNGKPAGSHAGGRTTFTLDVTGLIGGGTTNILAVRADYPPDIQDLPWVSGGDSTNYGFSEGSQPMGIFRPVHLVTTGVVRVEPFGVHVWNDATITETSAVVHVETEIRNYDTVPHQLRLETRLLDHAGNLVAQLQSEPAAGIGDTFTVRQDTAAFSNVHRWSLSSPYLYTLETSIREGANLLDQVTTPFGIRVIHWPTTNDPGTGQFLLNGRPVFINGIAEYEHVLGAGNAFSDEQIRARVRQIEAAGFNAFRDAHQPHNLRYSEYWDQDGVLWWPQFCAHIWFDTPAFRANFKTLLRDWVRERRNSPSLVLWGLSNESRLPTDFAEECRAIIRELDPTASSQRLITTCNGGKGTDWIVPQDWSGTYGGNPLKYADDLRRMKLVGEYGAWRSLGLHTEGGYVKNAPLSEDRFAGLLETKVRLGESARDASCGQFAWVFATHENPGRQIGGGNVISQNIQGGDGIDPLDRIGPANNKGLLTLWGEPTDAYYMYRANYAPAATDPMVMIVSHTWPDRWSEPGVKTNLIVYSNCEEVELFNDFKHLSLGRRTRAGIGTHFQWDGVDIRYNVLYAEGRVGGKVVATDVIVLHNLPAAPHRAELNGPDTRITAPAPGFNYLYRVNCGGTNYTDTHGNLWLADRDDAPGGAWGSRSWAADYDNVPARFGSQREMFDPIAGTQDEALFQTYRYGREKLRYRFAVPNGEYRVELYFAEPWYGRGGGDCTGWRLFDVAVNGDTVIHNLDLWREAGYAHALKKVVSATVRDGLLEISFPRVASYQAVISAIAIATADLSARAPADAFTHPPPAQIMPGDQTTALQSPPANPGVTYLATDGRLNAASLVNERAALQTVNASVSWTIETGLGGQHDVRIRYRTGGKKSLRVELKVVGEDGGTADVKRWNLPPSARGSYASPEGGLGFNAGKYTVTFTLLEAGDVQVKSLTVK